MPTPLEKRKHTDAVIAALQAAGLTVGDGIAPTGAEAKYVVVYPIEGGNRTGTLAGPFDDAELVYQLTCVGDHRWQAEWVRDKAEAALLSGLTVAGRHIPLVSPDEGDSGIRRDDSVTPALYYATPRYRIRTTPA
jgi:hypothetical protein